MRKNTSFFNLKEGEFFTVSDYPHIVCQKILHYPDRRANIFMMDVSYRNALEFETPTGKVSAVKIGQETKVIRLPKHKVFVTPYTMEVTDDGHIVSSR